MTRFGFLLTALAACGYDAPSDVAVFHGSVGQATTHVMAVSPVAGDLVKVVAPTTEGTFAVSVEPGRPYAFVFLDASQRGAGMVRGVLRSDSLDTFVPMTGGDIDLGAISIDSSEATMAGSSEDLDYALGVSRRTLATLGGIDDIALRYANPDMDGDGVIDALQGIAPTLEVHAEYAIEARGHAATARDFIVSSNAISFTHVGTGVYGRLPETFGSVDRTDADVTFDQPYYGFWAGDQTEPIPGGQPVQHLTFGDDRTFGVYCRPDHAVPTGSYSFRSGPHRLDFSFVRPPVEMTMHQVMPRVRFVPADAACHRDCLLDRVEVAWQRMTPDGPVQLTDEEAQVLRPSGALDLVFADGGTRRIEFPVGTATGEVPWDLPLKSTEPVYYTGQITFGSISFQSRPGIKMFARF